MTCDVEQLYTYTTLVPDVSTHVITAARSCGVSLHFGCVDNHADGLQVAGVWVLIVAELCTHRLVELGELCTHIASSSLVSLALSQPSHRHCEGVRVPIPLRQRRLCSRPCEWALNGDECVSGFRSSPSCVRIASSSLASLTLWQPSRLNVHVHGDWRRRATYRKRRRLSPSERNCSSSRGRFRCRVECRRVHCSRPRKLDLTYTT